MTVAAAVGVVTLTLVPIAFIVVATLDAGPALVAQLVFRPRVAELIGNTVAL